MMQIDGTNFQATALNKVKIKKYDTKKKKFVSAPGMFVLLDGSNSGDFKVISYISKKWKDASYIKEITTAANWMGHKDYIKIFALTEQKKNFDKLSPKKILGLAEMREEQEEGNVLSHIQVKPSAININSGSNKYKKTGYSMLKSLKKLYNQISLVSVRDDNIEKFYKDNGFVEYAEFPGNFVWYKNIFKRYKLKVQNFFNRAGMF